MPSTLTELCTKIFNDHKIIILMIRLASFAIINIILTNIIHPLTMTAHFLTRLEYIKYDRNINGGHSLVYKQKKYS